MHRRLIHLSGAPRVKHPGLLSTAPALRGTIAALSVGMSEGEYGGGLRKGTLGETTLGAEKAGRLLRLPPLLG
jgi:hypothetical protein